MRFLNRKKDKDIVGNKALNNISPSFNDVDRTEATAVILPTSASSYFRFGAQQHIKQDDGSCIGVSCEESKIVHQLPKDRASRYEIYEIMGNDPTIDSAIKMHIANALSSTSDNEAVIKFESLDHKENMYVKDLQETFSDIIRKNIDDWAYQAALYGACFVRVYGEAGKGITSVRCDYYTLPRFVNKFEKGGRSSGFTSAFQGASVSRQIQLIEPWKFVGFELPSWNPNRRDQPSAYGPNLVDLSLDSYDNESLIESQDYGSSLLQTAYQPWRDLIDAVHSLKMSRQNAARLERLVAVSTGKLDPQKAADYLNRIGAQITNTSNDLSQRVLDGGGTQSVINHLFPVFGENGRVDINTVQGTPDINGLEDVLFHVKRLGSALGVDPSLLGFGDFLSGGLGDGGFFRVSIMAAIKANALRRAIANGMQRLAEIHIAYKYNKVFAPNTCPWKITFNSVSTAVEREMQEALESKINIAGAIVNVIGIMDQEFSLPDKRELMRNIWCDMLKFEEDSFEKTFPKSSPDKVDIEANSEEHNIGEQNEKGRIENEE